MESLRLKVAIAACILLSIVLGSIHAFSVFIPQWESIPGGNRANVSLIYSFALISLTIAVLLGYRVYQLLSPSVIFTCVGLLAALGLVLSAKGSSLVWLYVSYGMIFGTANGLGYGYALQLSGQIASDQRGMVMGLVTAFYAVGATAAPGLFAWAVKVGGNALALQVMSFIVLVVAIAGAVMVQWSGVRFQSVSVAENQALSQLLKRTRLLLWVAYGGAVSAGLMIIGHAYSISLWLHLQPDAAIFATTVIAFCNMFGGFTAGYLADRVSGHVLLRWLPAVSCLGLLFLLGPIGSSLLVVFGALGLIGYSYGAIIAAYPVLVSDIFGSLAAPKIYGQIFTAWGLAGLLGPWSSGWLYDLSGSYMAAILVAVLLSVISMLAIYFAMHGEKQ